jgi:2-oxoisovalerate dehydrogenase E1 component
VHEDVAVAGFGAEVAATIVEDAFIYLDAPVARLAAPSVPVPYNYELMNAVVPTVAEIRQRMEALLSF